MNSHPRKPGELAFAGFLVGASLLLLWSAYGISGFESLSAPGAIPLATTATMVVTSIIILKRAFATKAALGGSFFGTVFPVRIALIVGLLLAYAVALQPLGFLPTSALFLVLTIKYLSNRSWVFSMTIGLVSLICIYLVFRIVFTVLMPAGIVPEGQMLAWVRNLLNGGI
ncbi:tripartite tricarboxylate transporter TctB family protein [Pacificibacter sp.]|uniref:tripartite tricarboxylate transporter TctB family protein n=1 Tax=Pacificibacter sp. TaxID=1917866 RepID=UPI003218FD2B